MVALIFAGIAIVGSFLVASSSENRRFKGFILFTIANIGWACYGIKIGEVAIVVQFGFFTASAIIGVCNNHPRKLEQ